MPIKLIATEEDIHMEQIRKAQRPIRIQLVDEEPDVQEFENQLLKLFGPSTEESFRDPDRDEMFHDPESIGYFREVLGVNLDDAWDSLSDSDSLSKSKSLPESPLLQESKALSDLKSLPESESLDESDLLSESKPLPDSKTLSDSKALSGSKTMVDSNGKKLQTVFENLDLKDKIALLLIHNSRNGIYTPFAMFRGIIRYFEDKRWCYLASLSFDILICMRRYNKGCLLSREVEYFVSGYRYRGRELDVMVTDRWIFNWRYDDFIKELEPEATLGTGTHLYMGNEGHYYTDVLGFRIGMNYFWLNDIPDTLAHLAEGRKERADRKERTDGKDRKNRISGNVMEEPKEYSLLDYAKLSMLGTFEVTCPQDELALRQDGNSEWIHTRLPIRFEMAESEFPDKKEFKVINHFCYVPIISLFSKHLPIFLADKKKDGSWSLGQDMTCSYPSFCEILAHMYCRLRAPDLERYMLVVDRNTVLNGPEDFKRTVCGFLLKQDSLEVFDRETALDRFEDALREAFNSGNYEIRSRWEWEDREDGRMYLI